MPIVLFAVFLGTFLGYWLARTQLKGKWILVEEAMEEATWRAIEIEQERQAATPPTPPPVPLSEQWGLPNYRNAHPEPQFNAHDLPLIREDGRPQWSAKQIIGYNLWGYEHSPQYPGGLPVWDAVVNGITPNNEESE